MHYDSSKNSSVESVGLPCTKTAYRRHEDAEDMIRFIQVTGYTRVLHSYQCPVCSQWHLNSEPDP